MNRQHGPPVIAITLLLYAPLGLGHGEVSNHALIARGSLLAQQHCAGCHGMDGIGVLDHDPNLAGQKYHYLIHELENIATGRRPNDRDDGPFTEAHRLSPDDIEAVSAYYASLTHRHTLNRHQIETLPLSHSRLRSLRTTHR